LSQCSKNTTGTTTRRTTSDPDAAIVGLILVGGIHGAEIDRLVDVVRYWRDIFFACGVSAKVLAAA